MRSLEWLAMCRVILLTCLDNPMVQNAPKTHVENFKFSIFPYLTSGWLGPEEEIFVIVRHKTKFWYNPNVNNIDSFFVFKTSYG